MNTMEKEFTPEEQRALDLLVDGELGEAERRAFLAALDERPGAWRRCALAFLEAQSWQHSLHPESQAEQAVRVEAAPVTLPAGIPLPASATDNVSHVHFASRSWWHLSHTGLPLATAASFLIAFGLAWMIREPKVDLSGVGEAGSMPPSIAALAGANSAARQPVNAGGPAPWDALRLVVDDGPNGREQEIALPVVETASAGDLRRDLERPAIPPAIRDALERMGHRVHERRQLVPVELRDGRQAVVPVDDIEFTPVSARAYQ